MPRKGDSTEQIVTELRQAEIELGRGLRTPQVCKQLGVSEQTYYRWRWERGGLRLDQAKRLTAARLIETARAAPIGTGSVPVRRQANLDHWDD
jgi:transposase